MPDNGHRTESKEKPVVPGSHYLSILPLPPKKTVRSQGLEVDILTWTKRVRSQSMDRRNNPTFRKKYFSPKRVPRTPSLRQGFDKYGETPSYLGGGLSLAHWLIETLVVCEGVLSPRFWWKIMLKKTVLLHNQVLTHCQSFSNIYIHIFD